MMAWYWIGLACFAAGVLLQIIAGRAGFIRDSISRYIACAVAANAAMVAYMIGTPATEIERAAAILASAFLSELYLFLFTLSLGSVSCKILALLRFSPLSRDEIEARYAPARMVQMRFKRLLLAGLARADGRSLHLTSKGRALVALVDQLRAVLHSPLSLGTERPARHPAEPSLAAPSWFLPSYLISIGALAALILAPLLTVIASRVTLTGMYEESIGYRYFYALRRMAGERDLFLPQGQLQDLVCRALITALRMIGYSPTDIAGTVDAFARSSVGVALVLAIAAFAWAAKSMTASPFAAPLTAILWGSVFYLPNLNTLFAALQPDYLPYVLPIGIAAQGLVIRLTRPDHAPRWRDAVALGLYCAACLSTKLSFVVFAGSVVLAYVLAHLQSRALIIAAVGVLLGCAVALGVILLDYSGGLGTLVSYSDFLYIFLTAGADVPPQTAPIWTWALEKISTEHYLHGTLVILPIAAALAAISSLRRRRLPAVPIAVLVASLAYCLVLYRRDYPGTNIEVAVFVCFALLCLWNVTGRPPLQRYVAYTVNGAQLVLVVALAAWDVQFYGSVLEPLIRGPFAENTTVQNHLHAAISTLPRPILWLVPRNELRPFSVHSAIMKGGGRLSSGWDAKASTIMAAISPDTDYLVRPDPTDWHTRWPLSEYRSVLFAAPALLDDSAAITEMQSIFHLGLTRSNCTLLTDMQIQRIVACHPNPDSR